MPATLSSIASPPEDAFRHEALLYAGTDDFMAGTVPFLRAGVAAGQPALVVVDQTKIRLLRSALGDDADRVRFADMAEVGHNPARIIPAWQRFLDDHATKDRGARGVGEPIWAARNPAELVECQRHEALLNVAFDGGSAWWLLCPYDTETLGTPVIEEARRSHPFVVDHGHRHRSSRFSSDETHGSHLADPLPEPTRLLDELTFGPSRLGPLRAVVTAHAARFGLDRDRTGDLALAVHEVATNSLLHGGGLGSFRLWREAGSLVCEISDRGQIPDPLAGRREPTHDTSTGRGLWLANQLCDLVQIRSFPTGSVVRLHMAFARRGQRPAGRDASSSATEVDGTSG